MGISHPHLGQIGFVEKLIVLSVCILMPYRCASLLISLPYFGGGDSQTEPAKIGTAAPYFLKVPFEASHLSLGNENIVSYFRRISDSAESVTFSPDGFQTELSLFSF